MFVVTELDGAKKHQEADKKAIDELVRERDILNKVQMEICLTLKIRPFKRNKKLRYFAFMKKFAKILFFLL